MRELKFRAWNIMVERYEYFTLKDLEGKKGVQWHILKIEQFTGLQDKNGKDIYEGDLLRLKCHKPASGLWQEGGGEEKAFIRISAVEWFTSGGSHGYRLKRGRATLMIKPYALVTMEARICGNIHENPELLQGGKEC